MTKVRIVTHGAGFHADDVFGVAALKLFLKSDVEVIRTRDPKKIAEGDYVLDVGFVYDPTTNRFDHHQEGRAGVRENGIPYASFGLIWKKFGEEICKSREVAEQIDAHLVQAIDAYDNGVELYTEPHEGKSPYLIQDMIAAFERVTRDTQEEDRCFLEAVRLGMTVLQKEILRVQEIESMRMCVEEAYASAEDKQLIVVHDEKNAYDRWQISKLLAQYPEPLFFVFKNNENNWQAGSVLQNSQTLERRKSFPSEWAGKRGDELAEVTGVPAAFFCHNGRFTAVAKTKEGAIKLAEIALAS